MKSIMMLVTLAATALSCAYGAIPVTNDTSFLAAVDAAVNGKDRSVPVYVFSRMTKWCTNTAVSADAVSTGKRRLAEAGVFPASLRFIYSIRPEHADYARAWAVAASNDYPTICSHVIGTDGVPDGQLYWQDHFRTDTCGIAFGEMFKCGAYHDREMEVYVSMVKRLVARQVKIHLRKQGKSFVTKDGVNPLDAYANRLEAILNAPRMAGLSEFFAEIGLPCTLAIPSESFITDQDAKALCDKILVDDEKLGRHNAFALRYSMGTEAYNKFVKLYNDGETK